jgi:AbiV family abortive infection protein
MNLGMSEPEQGNTGRTPALESLIADFRCHNLSAFELLASAQKGDYWAYVQVYRLIFMLARDPRAREALLADVQTKAKATGHDLDDEKISRELARKDGDGRFKKLTMERAQEFNSHPSLLSGTTFDTCLDQYKALIEHVEKLWSDAVKIYALANHPIAAFLSILVIEEVGKLSRLAFDLMFYDIPRSSAGSIGVERSHRRKHFIGVVSGALINARLDRVLGKDVVRRILHEAESNGIEKTRQECLYIDMRAGEALTPSQRIDGERARELIVLAGELMAEVLGHFPWEFDRMLDNVIVFERSIGVPEKKIARS